MNTLSSESDNGTNNKDIICQLMESMFMHNDQTTTSNEEKQSTINIRYTNKKQKTKKRLQKKETSPDVLNIGVDVLLNKDRIRCQIIVIFKRKSNKFFPCTDINLCYKTLKEEDSKKKN